MIGLVGVLLGSSIAKADALFTKDLYFGLQGDSDVTKLQEFLTSEGVYSGPITGNFFSLTLTGVKNFQSREGIAPVAGYFGPKTRSAANAILSQQLQASNEQAISETSSTPPAPTAPATTNDVQNSLQAQMNVLLQQVALLQKQLAAQQQTNQTLQQIQQNTTPPVQVVVQPLPTPAPAPAPNPSDTIAPIITAVQTANITKNAAVIAWTTNEYGDSVAYFGLSPGSYFSSTNGSVSAISTGYLHAVNLSSLSANTTYYYKVTSRDSSGNKGTSNEYSFTTAQELPGAITASQNPRVGSISVVSGSVNIKIGSYAITASAASTVTINSVTIGVGAGSTSSPTFYNLRVWVGGLQFGTTQSTGANGGAYSFSGTPFNVPKGGTVYVDVYADISSASNMSPPSTILSGCSGIGVDANNTVSCNTVNGQNVTIAAPPSISVSVESALAPASQIVMGSTGNTLAVFRFAETSNSESVKITDLAVNQNTTTKCGFGNLTLYQGSTPVGTAGSCLPTANGYSYSFHFATPVVVPQANSISLTLKGDVVSYSSSGAMDNSTHVFSIMARGVTAFGSTSNAAATVSGYASSNTMTIIRTKLTVSVAQLGSTVGRAKTSIDDLATLNFEASPAGALKLNNVVVTFAGSAPSSGAGFFNVTSNPASCLNCVVQIYDAASAVSYWPIAASGNTLTFNLGGYTMSAGMSKNFTLRVDSTNGTPTGTSGVSQTLGATIASAGDVSWTDGLDSAAVSGLGLVASTIPINIQSVAYAAGT